MDQVRAVAATAATVLIQGESGVGKELLARRIHEESPRRGGPFVKVDCASIPRDLFEGELFGHVSGAVPGAMRDRTGHIEHAEGGTLFLDEVGDIPSELQVKLLRPLQDSTFERVGDGRTRRADVRFIAATNRDLTAQVSQGLLRRDLYFRLSVFPIKVPPLRARLEDIPVLARHFLAAHRSPGHRSAAGLTDAHVHHLQTYDWPGNVRELKNVVERASDPLGGRAAALRRGAPEVLVLLPRPHLGVRGTGSGPRLSHGNRDRAAGAEQPRRRHGGDGLASLRNRWRGRAARDARSEAEGAVEGAGRRTSRTRARSMRGSAGAAASRHSPESCSAAPCPTLSSAGSGRGGAPTACSARRGS